MSYIFFLTCNIRNNVRTYRSDEHPQGVKVYYEYET